ncbi:MAG TPA: hypothetical protein VHM67_12930 [Gemmatimonadaceae bacterium]|nr:hypothetical protein [Gemmatimonadaceae bacterium]
MLRLARRVQVFVAPLLAVLLFDASATQSSVCATMKMQDQSAAAPLAAHDHSPPPSDARQPDDASERGRAAAPCLMSASCALVGVVDVAVVAMDLVVPAATAEGVDDALPPSAGIAPEPPPPRG